MRIVHATCRRPEKEPRWTRSDALKARPGRVPVPRRRTFVEVTVVAESQDDLRSDAAKDLVRAAARKLLPGAQRVFGRAVARKTPGLPYYRIFEVTA